MRGGGDKMPKTPEMPDGTPKTPGMPDGTPKIPGMPDGTPDGTPKTPGMPDGTPDALAALFATIDTGNLMEAIAENLVEKIQEKLPDKTTDSITVKSDIYKKILLVIQAHLQSKTGKQMLLSHIDKIIQPEIDKLTTDNEINKRILKMIFKTTDISKKLIELIAKNTTDTNATNIQTGTTGPTGPKRFDTNISGIISDFSIWIDEENKTGDDEPEIVPPPPVVQNNIEQKIKELAIENTNPRQSGGKTKKRRTKNNKRKTLRNKQKRTKRKYRK
jgi:hypothetical protein